MAFKKIRSMKVLEQSGYKYKPTPAIMLKGQWLKEAGFEIGMHIEVHCEDGKLIITQAAADAYTKADAASVMNVAEPGADYRKKSSGRRKQA